MELCGYVEVLCASTEDVKKLRKLENLLQILAIVLAIREHLCTLQCTATP